MKNKLTAILAALLLSLTLIPSQAAANINSVDTGSLYFSELWEQETPDTPNDPEEPETPVLPSSASGQPEEPDWPAEKH